MKKILFGIALGAAICIPAGVLAYQSIDVESNRHWTNEIYRFNRGCEDNDSSTVGETCGKVDVFDDKDNKCYVAYGPKDSVAISCVNGR